jgi:enoyl-CoA hydratase
MTILEAQVAPVEVVSDGALMTITLTRPEAINALTTPMVRAIDAALDDAEVDDRVAAVLIQGAGERGLCAGGDIAMFRSSALAGDGAAREFWREEYALNGRIARFPKPVVALMDGIVFGGGVGLSGHARHRIATERLVWAMPEVGIGFCPDVGGTLLLARAPGELGLHVALTASRLGAADAIACGFADRRVRSADLDILRAALRDGDVEAAIAAVARDGEEDGEAAELPALRPILDPIYALSTAAEIVAGLERDPRPAATAAAAAIRRASPTAVEVTLQAIRRAREIDDLERCLAQVLRVSTAFLDLPDFVEGIRAAVIDKDREPRWVPARLEEVDPRAVADAFGLGVD